jgi:type VI protein secretion system component VasK
VVIAATSYPFLNVLWSTLIFCALLIWIWTAVTVFSDLFSRQDVSGWSKAWWVVFIIFLPYVGVLTYLILYHDGMADRRARDERRAQNSVDAYIRQAAGGPASEIQKAKDLLDSGTISLPEFESIKARALS